MQDLYLQSLTGLDAEHRPTSLTSEAKVAVLQVQKFTKIISDSLYIMRKKTPTLQIATPDRAYILDFNLLVVVLSDRDWSRLASAYFLNPLVTVLGFSLGGDFQILSKTVPGALRDLEKRTESALDLDVLERQVVGATHNLMSR